MSRIVRAQVLKLKDQEFVLAARTLGVSNRDILFKEILPNSLGQIIITFMFSIPNAIFLEAFLAFVGLGVPAPMASLGSLINDGYKSVSPLRSSPIISFLLKATSAAVQNPAIILRKFLPLRHTRKSLHRFRKSAVLLSRHPPI